MKIKSLFIAIFLVLAIYVSNLHLFVDDYLFFYNQPRLIQNLPLFFQNYTTTFGVYRPIAVIYYYLIFSLYQISPAFSHLIPLALQTISGYLIYRILKKQGLKNILALLAGLIFVTHPFASEQYMWLAANQGVLASLIFLWQLHLIQQNKPFKPTIISILILSLASMLTYESTFFFFIPLSYLLYLKFKKPLINILSLNLIPIGIYIITKIIVKPTIPRPLVNSPSLLIQHINDLINNLFNVHLDPNYLQNFWTSYRNLGLDALTANPAALIFALSFVFGLTAIIITTKNHSPASPSNKIPIIFWLLIFLSSLPPLVANKVFYFGFRSLFLPTITGIILLFWFFQTILQKNMLRLVSLVGLFTIFSFILINIAIATKYQQLYQNDLTLSQSINQIILSNDLDQTPSSTTIILTSQIPFDSRNTFLHADHLLSCFFYEWTSPACLKTATNSIRSIAIKHSDGRLTLPPNTTYDQITNQRPIIYLTYQVDKTLVIDDIQK